MQILSPGSRPRFRSAGTSQLVEASVRVITTARRAVLAAVVACGLGVASADATPVATSEHERQLLGRVFPEPIRSVDFINHGPKKGPEELRLGFEFLERLYLGYLDFTTVADELGDPNGVSLGRDGRPAWDPTT
jgi:hypothetical protein